MREKWWDSIPLQPFTADGTSEGLVTVADALDFHVQQRVTIQASSQIDLQVIVKRVYSATTFAVGPLGTNIDTFSNLSNYTVVSGAIVFAPAQTRPSIPEKEFTRAAFAEEPATAWRTLLVDQLGNPYSSENPVPANIESSISIGQVEVKGSTGNIIEPNSDGSLNVRITSSPTAEEGITAFYNESASVPPGVETTILTYTVAAGNTANLMRLLVSGENVARYDIAVNATIISTSRTYFGGSLDFTFNFSTSAGTGYNLNAGDVVTVNVLHSRPVSAIFEATLEAVLNPIVSPGSNLAYVYSEMSVVAPNVSQLLASYTVGVGKTSALQRVIVSGENIARFDILINGSAIATKRTYFGGNLNQTFEFLGAAGGGLAMNAGDILTVKVFHTRPTSATFEAMVESIEYT